MPILRTVENTLPFRICRIPAESESQLVSPVAARIEHREDRHGEIVVDPYYWLRENLTRKRSVILRPRTPTTAAMTADIRPFEEALYKEMLGRIKQTDLSVPTRRGRYFYYSRTEEGKQYPIQCRREGRHGCARGDSAGPERIG